MGVQGLETYLEQNAYYHQAFYDIDIKKIIEDYKEQSKLPPTIIINASNANRFIYKQNVWSWIHGGQLKHYVQELTNLISQLQNIGAEVVVCFQGVTLSSLRYAAWKSSNDQSMGSFVEIFENIKGGSDPNNEEKKSFMCPNNLRSAAYYASKIKGCKIICSTTNTISFLAFYAKKHGCLGILAQDSDLMIHESAKYYLSMKHLNVNTMITKNYDRKKLIEYFGILNSHLPLLASLMGNSIMKRKYLLDFHNCLKHEIKIKRNSNYSPLAKSLADFIKSLPYLKSHKQEEINIRKLGEEVFKDNVDLIDLFVESVMAYQNEAKENENLELLPIIDDCNWNAILREAHHSVTKNPLSRNNAYIIINQTLSLQVHVEDFLNISPCFEIIKPLLEKSFGILLYERPGESKVLVHYQETPPNFIDEYFVEPVFPSVEHPGLLSLWSGDAEKKWSMIGAVFDISSDKIRSLPPQIIVPGLAFRFLKNKLEINNDEMDALISSACLLSELNADFLKRIDRSGATIRSLNLYGIVTTTFWVIIEVFDAVGNPIPLKEITPVNYQDGLLFNLKYSQASDGCDIDVLCDNKEEVIKRFHQLKSFILS